MNERIGKYINQKVTGESYKAYVPAKLPPKPPLDLASLYPYLEKATLALGELNAICKSIPNKSLFIYTYVRKEALLSCQIEGTQSSFADLMLFENLQQPKVALQDVEEVSNYIKAISYGLEQLKNEFPLSSRLLREIHAVLLAGGRGCAKLPGEFRRSQNWIGGTRPGNALFVPPPVDHLDQCMADLENFLHDDSLPLLIKAALAHVQFESIHPFLDGNGRLGRLMITLLLCNGGMLDEPILYLSLFLKQNRHIYYELLQEVRVYGSWEKWVGFFLEGVEKSALSAITAVKRINELFAQDLAKIDGIGRARFACSKILEYIKKLPQVNVTILAKQLNMTAPTARSALKAMVHLGIMEEISGKKRDRIYVYRKYLLILEDGAEPLIPIS